jgi:hypothetical protein
VRIAAEAHPGPGIDRHRQRGDSPGGHQAASLCSGTGRLGSRDGVRTPARRASTIRLIRIADYVTDADITLDFTGHGSGDVR